MSMLAKEFYLESNPDTRTRLVLPRYRHINAKLECLYRDSLLGVSLEPGVLSELAVKNHLEDSVNHGSTVELAAKKQKGYDIIVKDNKGKETKVQVKSKELNSWVNLNKTRSHHYHEFTDKNSEFDVLYTVFIGNTFVWVCNPINNPKENNGLKERFRLNHLYGDSFIDYIINRAKNEWGRFGTEITNYRIIT